MAGRRLFHLTLIAGATLVVTALVPAVQLARAASLPESRATAALALLRTSPATLPLGSTLDARGVAVRFAPLGQGIYARYNVAAQLIEIDPAWADADDETLAAVLAHEATHVQDDMSGYLATGGASACLESEVRAFRTAASFWLAQFGPAGKPAPGSDLEVQLNRIAALQASDPGGLERLVRQTYVDQCSQ
jgi:hypothetical protein